MITDDRPIPSSDDGFGPHERARFGVEARQVAVERDGLQSGDEVDHDADLGYRLTTLPLGVSSEYRAGGLLDVTHELSLSSSYEEAPHP
jgi:hypothetical protein